MVVYGTEKVYSGFGLSCSLNLSFSFVVQVSLHAAVLLVSQGLSVRGGFVTTTV